MLTLTNFNENEKIIELRPKILVVGAIDGKDIFAANSLYYLAKYICNNRNGKYWDLLNFVQLKFLPIANPKGYF